MSEPTKHLSQPRTTTGSHFIESKPEAGHVSDSRAAVADVRALTQALHKNMSDSQQMPRELYIAKAGDNGEYVIEVISNWTDGSTISEPSGKVGTMDISTDFPANQTEPHVGARLYGPLISRGFAEIAQRAMFHGYKKRSKEHREAKAEAFAEQQSRILLKEVNRLHEETDAQLQKLAAEMSELSAKISANT